MLKSISFKKLAVLTAGLAIVLSSCGLQNQASESSGDETAAGKTKNFALVQGGICFEDKQEQLTAIANYGNWGARGPGRVRSAFEQYWDALAYQQGVRWAGQWAPGWDLMVQAKVGGCPKEAVGVQGAESTPEDVQGFNSRGCIKPDVKQTMIDGYTEQLARPVGGEVTEAYIAEMQKGLDITKATCTN